MMSLYCDLRLEYSISVFSFKCASIDGRRTLLESHNMRSLRMGGCDDALVRLSPFPFFCFSTRGETKFENYTQHNFHSTAAAAAEKAVFPFIYLMCACACACVYLFVFHSRVCCIHYVDDSSCPRTHDNGLMFDSVSVASCHCSIDCISVFSNVHLRRNMNAFVFRITKL